MHALRGRSEFDSIAHLFRKHFFNTIHFSRNEKVSWKRSKDGCKGSTVSNLSLQICPLGYIAFINIVQF